MNELLAKRKLTISLYNTIEILTPNKPRIKVAYTVQVINEYILASPARSYPTDVYGWIYLLAQQRHYH
jgi:hypothetical protein